MSERTHVPRGSLVGCQSKVWMWDSAVCEVCAGREGSSSSSSSSSSIHSRKAAAASMHYQALLHLPPPLTLPGWCRFQWKPFGTVWSMIDFRYTERVLEVDGHWEHVVTLSTLNFGIDSNFYSLPSFSECDNREVRRNYFWETFFCFQLYRSRQ